MLMPGKLHHMFHWWIIINWANNESNCIPIHRVALEERCFQQAPVTFISQLVWTGTSATCHYQPSFLLSVTPIHVFCYLFLVKQCLEDPATISGQFLDNVDCKTDLQELIGCLKHTVSMVLFIKFLQSSQVSCILFLPI